MEFPILNHLLLCREEHLCSLLRRTIIPSCKIDILAHRSKKKKAKYFTKVVFYVENESGFNVKFMKMAYFLFKSLFSRVKLRSKTKPNKCSFHLMYIMSRSHQPHMKSWSRSWANRCCLIRSYLSVSDFKANCGNRHLRVKLFGS